MVKIQLEKSLFLIGKVPKKTVGFWLITHSPSRNSLNDFIDPSMSTVSYSGFDNAAYIIKKLGSIDWENELPVRHLLATILFGDLDLLGFTLRGQYFVGKMIPVGLKIACKCWECLSKFLNWLIIQRKGLDITDHYLDDFSLSFRCMPIVNVSDMRKELGVQVAEGKLRDQPLLSWVTARYHKVLKQCTRSQKAYA